MSNHRIHIDETYSLKVADTVEAFDPIFEVVLKGVQELGEEDIDIEYLKTRAWEFVTAPVSQRVLLVLYKDLKPIGVLLGAKVEEHPVYRRTGITVEQLWYVVPESRGSKAAIKLVEAFEEWSRKIGVKRCVMSHFINPVGERVAKYYERSNFKKLEESWVKELK